MVKLSEYRDIKVVVVGDGTVGKTCLLIRYCQNKFTAKYLPTIFDNKVARVRYNDKMIGLNLWDTAGQEDYDTLRPLSYQETDVFILCFDVMNKNSFKNIKFKWYDEVNQFSSKANLILCGTKLDLRDDTEFIRSQKEKGIEFVTPEDGEELRKEIAAYSYIETSSKIRKNVDELFLSCLDSCFRDEEDEDDGDAESEGGGCCVIL